MKITGPRPTIRRARKLRVEMTLPEVHLWQALRTRPGGLKFRRQHPCGRYVLDFYCDASKLCVEVDGETHATEDGLAYDVRRDGVLAGLGITTLRFAANDVVRNVEGVVRAIVDCATAGPQRVETAPGSFSAARGAADPMRPLGVAESPLPEGGEGRSLARAGARLNPR